MGGEALIRTNPSTVNFEAVSGGIAQLTSEEIAAMLHNTHDGEFYLVMSKYTGQDHTKIVTHYLYKNNIPEFYQRYRMNDHERGRGKLNGEKGFLWQLTYLAVNEYIDPCRCLTCQGTKYVGDGVKDKIKPCPACKGSSHSRLGDDQKAQYLDTGRFQYWKPLYEKIYSLLNNWDCEALRLFHINGLDS